MEFIKYPKINSIFKRDPNTQYHSFTDEYSEPEFEYLKDNEWYFTEKIDGTNVRAFWDGIEWTLGGRNTLDLGFGLAPIIQRQLPNYMTMQDVFGEKSLILFGEGYGAGIQNGGGYRSDKGFRVFDIYIEDQWLNWTDVIDVATGLNLKTVSTRGLGTLDEAIEFVKRGFGSSEGTAKAEGLVLRPKQTRLNRRGQRIITKVKHIDYFPQEG